MSGPRPTPGSGPLLLGVDLGTQSAKVAVLTADGRVVAEGRQALRPTASPRPGVVEHPDDDLGDALAAACRAALADLAAAGGRAEDLVALGLCGIRSTRALLRADGTLAAPVISWMDERCSRPHDPATAPPGTALVTASSGYLTHLLTGRAVDSAAAYPGVWPLDLARRAWDADDAAVAAHGLRRDQLVDLVDPGTVLGRVTPAAAARCGLPAGLPVVATGNDKAVEALGCGLTAPGDALLSLGTYVAAMVVGDDPLDPAVEASGAGWTNLAAVPGRYLHESRGVRRGMWTVSWLRDLVGPAVLPGGDAEQLEAALGTAAEALPAGSDGLLTVTDWLAPPGEPWRRGAVVGFDGRHGAAHLYRSVLEGLALTMADHLSALTSARGLDVRSLVLSGGGARSAVMQRAVAATTGLPVRCVDGPGSPAARGAAACAAAGVGVHPTVEDAARAMSVDAATVEPDPDDVAAYADLARDHAALREALAGVLRARTSS